MYNFHLLNLFAFSFLSTLRKDSIAEPFYGLIGEVFELKGGTMLRVLQQHSGVGFQILERSQLFKGWISTSHWRNHCTNYGYFSRIWLYLSNGSCLIYWITIPTLWATGTRGLFIKSPSTFGAYFRCYNFLYIFATPRF